MFIGQYQLENLQKNRVGFVFFDLRSEEARAREGAGNALLNGAESIAAESVLSKLLEMNSPKSTPIVLICENGSNSLGVAKRLEDNSYINVFVIEGGSQTLDFSAVL